MPNDIPKYVFAVVQRCTQMCLLLFLNFFTVNIKVHSAFFCYLC